MRRVSALVSHRTIKSPQTKSIVPYNPFTAESRSLVHSGGGPTPHPPTLHEDNSTQKLDTERV